jgi:4'-phosphopantetheinyl transferase
MSHVDVLLTSAGEGGEIPVALLSALTADERDRASRFRQASDRWLFVLGRALLRYGLGKRFGIEQPRLSLAANGKPRLDPDHGVEFNLSHTRGYVACAFGQACDLGLDVERLDRIIDGHGIARAYFATPERDLLDRTPESGREDVFLRLWTLKEAVVKAAGLGLSLELDRFAVALDPPRLRTAVPELGDPLAWQLHEWCLPQSCRLALAIRRRNERPLPVSLAEVPTQALVGSPAPVQAAR